MSEPEIAPIIPIGTRGRPGRGSGTSASSAARDLAGGRPRSAPRKKTRPATPADPEIAPEAPTLVSHDGGSSDETATRPAIRTDDRHPLSGIPLSDWQDALTRAAREIFGERWEPRLAEFLAIDDTVRNIPGVKTAQVGALNVYDILRAEKLVIDKEAVNKLTEVYAQ